MASKKGRNRQQQVHQQQRKPTAPTEARTAPSTSPREGSTDALLEAEIAAEGNGSQAVPVTTPTAGVTKDSFDLAVAEYQAAKATFDALTDSLRRSTEQLQIDRVAVEEERATLAAEGLTLEAAKDELVERSRSVQERAESLESRTGDLARLQAEAEAGFLGRRDEILAPLTERIAELTAAWHENETALTAQWSSRLQDRRAELEREHVARLQELAEEQTQLNIARLELTKDLQNVERQRAEVRVAREVLAEDVEAFEADRHLLLSRARSEAEELHRHLNAANERLQARVAELEESASTLDELKRTVGLDPERLLSERIEMLGAITGLRAELSGRPGVEVREELDFARHELRVAYDERAESLRAQRELQSQLDYGEAELSKLEFLEQSKEALENSIGAHKATIKELSEQLGQLRDDREVQSAFPECTRMDVEEGSRGARAGSDVPDLEEFIEDLQYRMAQDADSRKLGKQLNYRLSDLRIFVAGLAMSQLHLLEGTSGTGKTTLPNAFANAVGGAARKVEVQAGWRDKQDLLGYYNSFERVYRETPCLQYLYRAGLPLFSDQIILIVLDEMNLSHPEQYFADFLSALEDPRADRRVSISDRGLPQVPKGMVEKTGVQLRLPPNVWFVGTANQDETTFAFAPKTYDRAHVMELKPNAPVVKEKDIDPRPSPVSFRSLQKAFSDAGTAHRAQANQAVTFIDNLAPFFSERFRVSWGNRLNDHIRRFVPVDVAAGGSLGEALDHILATKVLRKVQGRHSIRPDALEELAERIERDWVDKVHGPERAIEAIRAEIEELRLG